jgi:probable rRNA maturation factor
VDPDSRRVSVTVTDGRGRRIPDGGLARWLAAVLPARLRGDVAIALVTDPHIRKLNRQYRGKDYATDVLSFPVEDFRPFDTLRAAPSTVEGRLKPEATRLRAARSGEAGSVGGVASAFRRKIAGDIVIATGVAKRQARDARHSYQAELRVLALHGLLHLLGYDHDAPDDHGRMARAEARLRRRGGLAAGLIARAGAHR